MAAVVLAVVSGFSGAVFLVLIFRLFMLRRPVVVPVRSFYVLCAFPVFSVLVAALWKNWAAPRLVTPDRFFFWAAILSAAVILFLWRRPLWFYILGPDQAALESALSRAAGENEALYRREEGEIAFEDGQALFVQVFEGQDAAQMGADGSGSGKRLKTILASLKTGWKEERDRKRPGIPGFLIMACLVSFAAGGYGYLNVRAVNPDFYLSQGQGHLALEDPATALAAFERAGSTTAEALRWQGEALRLLDRYPEALDRFNAALELSPGNCPVRLHLARLFATAKDPGFVDGPRALTLIQETGDCGQGVLYADTLAAVLARNGRYAEAVRIEEGVLGDLKEKRAGKKLLEQVEKRLALYRAGQPLVE